MTSVSSSEHHMFSIPLEMVLTLETIGEKPIKRLNFDNIIKRIKYDSNNCFSNDDWYLTSISMALEREGYKVQTYIDSESALIGLTRNPPDLAILDIKMPRMDEALLKKLKKMSIPIIFTSKDDEVDELLGLKLGADDFVKKSGGFSTKVLIEE